MDDGSCSLLPACICVWPTPCPSPGKLKQVFKYVSTVDVHYSIKEETEEYTEWDAKLTMEYKNKWFNYLYL